MPAHGGRWGRWSTLLAGLPYDVQAALFNRLAPRNDLNPDSCYRLPILFSTPRLTVNAGAATVSNWRFLSLTAVYGISKSFSNETVQAAGVTAGVAGLTATWPDEVNIQISFNQGSTVWIGSNAEPCTLASIGSAGGGDLGGSGPTRVDPIVATREDQWTLTLTGQAALANAVFSTVTLHGTKIYNAGGAI